MEEKETSQPHRRRRKRGKSSKEAYQRRKKWKQIGTFLVLAIVGAALVALVAVFAGGGGS